MPIVNFEYTSNLKIEGKVNNFIRSIHGVLVEVIKTDLCNCRSTISSYSNYFIGDGNDQNAFIQISIRMLPGRDKAVKDKLGDQLLSMLEKEFSDETAGLNTQTRVYLTEIDRDYYYGL